LCNVDRFVRRGLNSDASPADPRVSKTALGTTVALWSARNREIERYADAGRRRPCEQGAPLRFGSALNERTVVMKSLHSRKGGFTLIELMIVVAIIGILAAIAIPNFLRFQLRAKSSEGKTNLAAIRTAEEGFMAEFGTYVAAAVLPNAAGSPPGTTKALWPLPVVGAPTGFETLGWAPEGEVYFNYAIDAQNAGGAGAALTVYTADAEADIDGDGNLQAWGYIKPLSDSTGAIAGLLGCPATGVENPADPLNRLLTTVGPCDAVSGQSVF